MGHWYTQAVILLLLVAPVLFPLIKPGFFPTQDYIYVARLFEMNKVLHDGQFPARWVPDFRYGEPLYNFYAPLPYYAGSLIKDLGFSFLISTKILFALSFILSAMTMYFLGRELFGDMGGILGAVLYTYAPYHSVDVYVRGALSEAWSLIFLPLIFLGALMLSRKVNLANFLLLVLSLAGLFYTHNIMSVLFMPFLLGWMAFLILQTRQIKLALPFCAGLLLAFALGASYMLPALLEKQFIQSQHLLTGYFNFRGHFVAAPQWFSTFWGYGASVWGTDDGMSFQVGLVHWAVLGLGIVLAWLNFRKNRLLAYFMAFLWLEFVFSLFMQHNKSAFIWEMFPLLAFVQFPWRFLGITIFLVSLAAGMVKVFEKRFKMAVGALVIILTVAFNINYFHPQTYYFDSIDAHYISPQVLSIDDKLPKDYLPIWVKLIDPEKINSPKLLSGQAQLGDYKVHSDWVQFHAHVSQPADVEVPVTYFPGWTARANGRVLSQEEPTNLGLIRLSLPEGSYDVKLAFADTLVRRAGNLISLLALLVTLSLAGEAALRYKPAMKG